MVGIKKKTEKLMHGGKLKGRWAMRRVIFFVMISSNMCKRN